MDAFMNLQPRAAPAPTPTGPPVGLAKPPPGVTPNFENPVSIWSEIVPSNLVGLSLATAFLCMRIYTRVVVSRAPGWDDFLSVVATAFSVGGVIASIKAVRYKGWHAWDIPKSRFNRSIAYKWDIIGYTTYMAGMGAVKLSILLLYLRLFSAGRRLKTIIYILIAFVVAYTVSGELSVLFGCQPIKKLWRPELPGKCFHTITHVISQAVFNLVADILIVAAPIPTIWSLKLPTRHKIAVTALFMLALSVCAVSVVRLLNALDYKNPDVTWRKCKSDKWSLLELNLAIICSCLPAVKPFLNHVSPQVKNMYLKGSSYFSKSVKSSNENGGSELEPPKSSVHPKDGESPNRGYIELGKNLPK